MLTSVDEVLALLAQGTSAFDEPELDVLSHSLQCAAILRAEHPDDVALIVAGLVHDIADAERPAQHDAHEERGAALVEAVFGARVAHLVRMHVPAKRYLVATDPAYRTRLSDRSVETLARQGGNLDAGEIARMQADPDLDAILTLRRADERAKDPHARVAPLESWRALLEAYTRQTK
jgi:predicted HD phosphohydrolase